MANTSNRFCLQEICSQYGINTGKRLNSDERYEWLKEVICIDDRISQAFDKISNEDKKAIFLRCHKKTISKKNKALLSAIAEFIFDDNTKTLKNDNLKRLKDNIREQIDSYNRTNRSSQNIARDTIKKMMNYLNDDQELAIMMDMISKDDVFEAIMWLILAAMCPEVTDLEKNPEARQMRSIIECRSKGLDFLKERIEDIIKLNRFDESEFYSYDQKIDNDIESIPKDYKLINGLLDLNVTRAEYFHLNKNLDSATIVLEKARKLIESKSFTESNNNCLLKLRYYNIAMEIYWRKRRYPEHRKAAEEAVAFYNDFRLNYLDPMQSPEIRKQISFKNPIIQYKRTLGLYYNTYGERDKAIESYCQARELIVQLGESDKTKIELAQIENNMAIAYIGMCQLGKAEQLHSYSKQKREEYDAALRATALHNYAVFYLRLRKYNEAMITIDNCIELREKLTKSETWQVYLVNSKLVKVAILLSSIMGEDGPNIQEIILNDSYEILESLEKDLTNISSEGRENSDKQYLYHQSLLFLYHFLNNRFPDAEKACDKAISKFKSIIEDEFSKINTATSYHSELVKMHIGKALCCQMQIKTKYNKDEVKKFFDEAEELISEILNKPNCHGKNDALDDYGIGKGYTIALEQALFKTAYGEFLLQYYKSDSEIKLKAENIINEAFWISTALCKPENGCAEIYAQNNCFAYGGLKERVEKCRNTSVPDNDKRLIATMLIILHI